MRKKMRVNPLKKTPEKQKRQRASTGNDMNKQNKSEW